MRALLLWLRAWLLPALPLPGRQPRPRLLWLPLALPRTPAYDCVLLRPRSGRCDF